MAQKPTEPGEAQDIARELGRLHAQHVSRQSFADLLGAYAYHLRTAGSGSNREQSSTNNDRGDQS